MSDLDGHNALLRRMERGRLNVRPGRDERVATAPITSLLHHLDPAMLRTAFFALRWNSAVGVDGLTWRAYEADLDRRIDDLHRRIQRGAYRAQPARRRFIPKPDGRQRPLAIAALEDKIVQRATVAVLNGIYEEDFLRFSYGFRARARPERCAGRALRRDLRHESEIHPGCGHPVVLRRGQPGMAGQVPATPDRRPAPVPPDLEMAKGGHPCRGQD